MIEVYDIETLASCFTYCSIDVRTMKVHKFVIHKDRDESKELYNHLCTLSHQIGFNNLNFDYPIIHEFLLNYHNYTSPEQIIKELYAKAQDIIDKQNQDFFRDTVAIKKQDCKIHQLDLFKIWHYNNTARRTSLKALQISMNYPNVMESKVPHTKEDITLEEVDDILEYNLNDVMSTYEFYLRSKEKLKLRNQFIESYNLPCENFSDTKIGEQLILKLYCDSTGKKWYDVKELRTPRVNIKLNECILDVVKFNSVKFKKLLIDLKQTTILGIKNEVKKSVIHKNFKYDFGSGGIHGAITSGVYESNSKYIIKTLDVASLYPSLSIINGWYPEHLGPVFCEVYEGVLKKRLQAKSEKNNVLSDGLKLSLNSVYGKSKEKFSFLYDPKFTMRITFNGQLLLAMLAERLADIPDSQVLMINTDGLEIKIPRIHEDLYNQISSDWEKETKLTLEHSSYKKICIRDVNNYIALDINNKIKNKGCFEIDKVVGSEPAYHKDNSFRIIALALQEYFISNIPVEDTIRNHKNIYDFCGREKFNKDSYGETHEIKYLQDGNPYEHIEKQQRNVRYYIKNKGKTFVKVYVKGTSELINKGYEVEIFNKYEIKQDYDINYDFYIKQCKEIINTLEPKQIKLWV